MPCVSSALAPPWYRARTAGCPAAAVGKQALAKTIPVMRTLGSARLRTVLISHIDTRSMRRFQRRRKNIGISDAHTTATKGPPMEGCRRYANDPSKMPMDATPGVAHDAWANSRARYGTTAAGFGELVRRNEVLGTTVSARLDGAPSRAGVRSSAFGGDCFSTIGPLGANVSTGAMARARTRRRSQSAAGGELLFNAINARYQRRFAALSSRIGSIGPRRRCAATLRGTRSPDRGDRRRTSGSLQFFRAVYRRPLPGGRARRSADRSI